MNSYLSQSIPLNSGNTIPLIGLGTYGLLGSRCERSVSSALKLGYRHIDTAQMYGNEDIIGRCIQPYERSSLFITSKIGPWQYGFKSTLQAFENTLENLQTDYVDLLLLNWPGVYGLDYSDPSQVELRHESYRALEYLKDEGKVKSIGVSNFLDFHLDKLLDFCSIHPSVNQIEFNPLCFDHELLKYCNEKEIVVEAASVLAKGNKKLWENNALAEITKETRRSTAQVLLNWAIRKGVIVLPKTKSVNRLKENSRLSFELTEGQERTIDQLNTGFRTEWNPNSITV